MSRWPMLVLALGLLALGAACSRATSGQLRSVSTATPAFAAGRDGAQRAAMRAVNEANTATTQSGSDQAVVLAKNPRVNEPSVANIQPSTCPVGRSACTFAEQLADAFAADDLDAILALAPAQPFTCDGPQPRGLGGPYPLCDGSEVGELRSGYPVSGFGTEGSVLSEDRYRAFVQGFVDLALPSESDARGTGELRLAGVACDKALAASVPPCAESPFTVVFSAIRRAPRLLYRDVVLFRVRHQEGTRDAIDWTSAGSDFFAPFSLDTVQPPGVPFIFFPFTHSGLRGK